MTPFDDRALLAMLLAFYPIASPAAFARARQERPEYFAAGVIFGSKGDKLRLPDGREFDCIIAAGLPGSSRWQVALIVPGEDGDGPFPLEPGPLTPLDGGDEPPAVDPATFAGLLGGAFESLGASAATIDAAHSALAETADAAQLADGGGGELEDADGALAEQTRDRGAFGLGDEIEALTAIDTGAAGVELEYDAAPTRPTLPPDPTPTKPPPSELPPTEPAPL